MARVSAIAWWPRGSSAPEPDPHNLRVRSASAQPLRAACAPGRHLGGTTVARNAAVEVLVLQIFVSLMLVIGAVLLFAWSMHARTHEHADRLALLPMDRDGAAPEETHGR